MPELVVTIDGPAGSGKSTVAPLLAGRLDASFLDTGAMYRAVTLAALRDKVDLTDEGSLLAVLDRHRFEFRAQQTTMQVCLDGQAVTEQIRCSEVTEKARYIASCPRIRDRLVQWQRAYADKFQRIVTEGRDQGTVAFPDADVKFYLTAEPAERARRRLAQLQAKGSAETLQKVQQAIEQRDASDATRSVAPMKPAPDAIIVDTTAMTIEQVVDTLAAHVRERCSKKL